MKKVFILMLSVLLIAGTSACSSTSSSASSEEKEETTTTEEGTTFTAGTYTATTTGMNGDLTVEVTFTEDKMETVTVTSQVETYGIGQGMDECPVEALPAAMTENGTVNVDSVTGATITSSAIKRAVSDCITQAGGDPDEMPTVHVAAASDDITTDVVVLGGGAAGLSAALEAANAGVKVTVIEKQGITGGSTTRSGGKLLAADTKWQAEQGFTDSADDLYDYLYSFSNGEIDSEKLRAFCDNSKETVEWLESLGGNFINVEPIHSSLTPWRVINSYGGGGQTSGHGGQFMVPLYNAVKNAGVEILYNTSGKELVQGEDGISGVVCETADGEQFTVTAGAVVIATGGYAHNEEMLDVFEDFLPSNIYSSVPAGNVGDGLVMAEAVGAKNYQADGLQLVYVSFTCGVGINEESGLIVSEDGERVVNEYTYQSHVAQALADADSTVGWYICTSNDPNPTVQYGMMLDSTPSASTVEDLAALIGVPADTLAATVARYNELCEKGVDEDFGKPAEYMVAVEGEKYYAIAMTPTSSVTFGGLDITLNSEVKDTNDQPIAGLYAAGEVANTGLFGKEYPCCGMAIGSAVYFGRIAGQQAAAYATK